MSLTIDEDWPRLFTEEELLMLFFKSYFLLAKILLESSNIPNKHWSTTVIKIQFTMIYVQFLIDVAVVNDWKFI